MQSRPVFYKSKPSIARTGFFGLALLSAGLGLLLLTQSGSAESGCFLESLWQTIAANVQHPAHRFVGRDMLG
jgi:hypothetical protein